LSGGDRERGGGIFIHFGNEFAAIAMGFSRPSSDQEVVRPANELDI